MDHLVVPTGPCPIDFRPERPSINVTEHMHQALQRMRAALITAALHRLKVTYGDLELATGGAYLSRGFGPALDVLSVDCLRRGEPSLAPLVVTTGGEVGSAFVGDSQRGREEVWAYWAGKAGRD